MQYWTIRIIWIIVYRQTLLITTCFVCWDTEYYFVCWDTDTWERWNSARNSTELTFLELCAYFVHKIILWCWHFALRPLPSTLHPPSLHSKIGVSFGNWFVGNLSWNQPGLTFIIHCPSLLRGGVRIAIVCSSSSCLTSTFFRFRNQQLLKPPTQFSIHIVPSYNDSWHFSIVRRLVYCLSIRGVTFTTHLYI